MVPVTFLTKSRNMSTEHAPSPQTYMEDLTASLLYRMGRRESAAANEKPRRMHFRRNSAESTMKLSLSSPQIGESKPEKIIFPDNTRIR
ncbi:hypothetical protein GCK32_004781, partial [Trichostrongylus colubriformis]